MKNFLSLTFCLLFASASFAQNGNVYWENIPSPPGGTLQLTHTIKGDTAYGRYLHDPEDLYRTANGAISWEKMEISFFGREINDSVVIGASGKFFFLNPGAQTGLSQLWGSENEGQTWQLLHPVELEISHLIETYTGTLLGWFFTSDSLRVLRSSDHGNSWAQVLQTGADTTMPAFIEAFQAEHVLLGGNIEGLSYLSNDDGLTWNSMTRPITSEGNASIAPSGTIFNFLGPFSRSVDNGQTWSNLSINGGANASLVWSMTFLPTGRILAHHQTPELDTLIYSDDDGITWQVLNAGIHIRELLSPYPIGDSAIIGLKNNSMYRSENGGTLWDFASTGVPHATIFKLYWVSDSILIANTMDGFWRTLDGHNWQYLDAFNNITAIRVGNEGHILVIDRNDHLLLSNDWGSVFNDITPPQGLQGVLNPFLFISPGDSIFMVRTQAGIVRSSNQGVDWELVPSGNNISEAAAHPSGRYYSTQLAQTELHYSDDFGRSWQAFTTFSGDYLYDLSIGKSGNIILSMLDQQLNFTWHRSTDNGATWEVVPVLTDAPFLVENAQGHLFTRENEFVARSISGGNNWQLIPFPDLTYCYINHLAIDDNEYLYVGTNNWGIFRTHNPTNEGAYIQGRILKDADADCSTADAQVATLDHWVVEANGAADFFTTTDILGQYTLFVDTGHYEVTVQSPQQLWWGLCDTVQSTYLPENFDIDTLDFTTVAISECPLITVNIAVSNLRRCFDNQVYVYYCNQGTELAENAWVDVALDEYLSFVGSGQNHQTQPNNTIRFFVGNLESGNCGQFQLTVNVDCDSTVLGQTHCLTAHGYPDTLCNPNQNWSGANLEASVECQDSVVRLGIRNTGASSSQSLQYIIIEDDVVMFSGRRDYAPSESLDIELPGGGHTWRIESEQEPGHPFSHRVLAYKEGCGGFQSLGYINQFNVNGITPSWHTICRENVGSFDPNDKQGFPLGVDVTHRINRGQTLDYMIRFQNTGTDTAFTVVVRDSLAATLDPRSIVPGAASHPYTWQLEGTGEVVFTFSNIQLPDSTTNLEGSNGFVTFRVNQQPNLAIGTRIFNQAGIYFDFNEAVRTNITMHTIGKDPLHNTVILRSDRPRPAVTIAPNPATDFATVTLEKGIFNAHLLQLFSPLGHLVFEANMSGDSYTIPRKNLPPGAYTWRVMDTRLGLVGSGVLIFQ